MKNVQSALSSVYERTGIASSVYSTAGELLFSAGEPVAFDPPGEDAFGGGVASRHGRTYCLCRGKSASYIVAIEGEGEAAANYAALIGTIVGSYEARLSGETVEEKLSMLLTGDAGTVGRSMLRSGLSEPEFRHFMLSLVAATPAMMKNLRHFLSTVSDRRDFIVPTSDRAVLYLRYAGDGDYRSASEFAGVLYENIKEELRIDLKIAAGGTAHDIDEVIAGYDRLIFTHRYGEMLDPDAPVTDYKDYVLAGLLAELPKAKLRESLAGLTESDCAEALADTELTKTADEFMRNSLNISETSRKMYIHRNTLIYRLDKIQKDTGLDLRAFGDAYAFRLIRLIDALLKDE